MKTTNKILVVDLEATCWEEDGEYQKTHSEIIEIGICVLNTSNGEITQKQGILVKSQRSKVSEFCTKLTTITPELLDQKGILLADACELIMDEYQSEDYTWASYGNYDKSFFMAQCKRFGVIYPMSNDHINVKVALSDKLKLDRGMGMERALKHLKIPMDGIHHRGVDDAYNTAKILNWILKH